MCKNMDIVRGKTNHITIRHQIDGINLPGNNVRISSSIIHDLGLKKHIIDGRIACKRGQFLFLSDDV